MLFEFKKWRLTFAEKHMKTFFRKLTSKKIFMILVGANMLATVAQKLIGHVSGSSAKNPLNPKHFPAHTPLHGRNWGIDIVCHAPLHFFSCF